MGHRKIMKENISKGLHSSIGVCANTAVPFETLVSFALMPFD